MSCLTQNCYWYLMTNQKQMLQKEKKSSTLFPQQVFPQLCSHLQCISLCLLLSLSISLSSSSHPCFFHCCVSPTELLWAHAVPSATDLLHSRAMFIKDTRESASYGLSHITYSIPPEAGPRHQSKHTESTRCRLWAIIILMWNPGEFSYKADESTSRNQMRALHLIFNSSERGLSPNHGCKGVL